jgi:uncharacterized iron-regulated protein
MSRRNAAVLVLLGSASIAGCCAPAGRRPCPTRAGPAVARTSNGPHAATPTPAPAPPTVAGTILDHRAGRAVEFDAFADRLASASHVYVGELHDQVHHHRFQAKVLRALADRWKGKPVALGMEMFYRPYQPALDAYVRGEISEKEMLAKTEWDTRWGFGWEMYAPMLRICRDRGIPVLALNAEKEVTRTVSQKGLEGLTPEQRASLPPLDTTDPAHRAFVLEAFGQHGSDMPPERFERFYLSMVIWDEVMSTGVANWLAKNGPDARVVVVAGNGHVADRFGVAGRAGRKTGRPYASVVQYLVRSGGKDAAEEAGDEDRTTVRHADYSAWWNASAPPKKAKPAPKPAAPEKPVSTQEPAGTPAKP